MTRAPVVSRRPHWSFYGFVPCTTLVLRLDATWLAATGFGGQWLAGLLKATHFAAMIATLDDALLRRTMWLAVVISALGEVVGSMMFQIWVYRHGYVPLYVPLSHRLSSAAASRCRGVTDSGAIQRAGDDESACRLDHSVRAA